MVGEVVEDSEEWKRDRARIRRELVIPSTLYLNLEIEYNIISDNEISQLISIINRVIEEIEGDQKDFHWESAVGHARVDIYYNKEKRIDNMNIVNLPDISKDLDL